MVKSVVLFMLLAVLTPSSFAEGEVKDLKQFEYWDNGKIKKVTMYDTRGFHKATAYCRYDGTVEKVERFDPAGNKIEEILYDQRGRFKSGIDGWAAMRWWYEGNMLVAQISYDENGVPMDRKEYSESGRLILRQYRDDANFSPYENAMMTMMLGARNVPYYDKRDAGGEE